MAGAARLKYSTKKVALKRLNQIKFKKNIRRTNVKLTLPLKRISRLCGCGTELAFGEE